MRMQLKHPRRLTILAGKGPMRSCCVPWFLRDSVVFVARFRIYTLPALRPEDPVASGLLFRWQQSLTRTYLLEDHTQNRIGESPHNFINMRRLVDSNGIGQRER